MSLETVLASLGIETFSGNAKILCPWHESDSDPSLSIDIQTGVFYCFGCGIGGNEVKLIAKLTGQNELQAMINSGAVLARNSTFEGPDRIDLQDDARDFFYSIDKPSWDVITRHYMIDKRRIHAVTLAAFDVRINQSSEYPIIVPIIEGREFKGYVCRRIDMFDPKYQYNKGFTRRSTVLGRLQRGVVMVVEGSLDMMSAYQFGFKNVCCTLGSVVTEEQMEKIGKGATKVICAFDNDRAGREGFQKLQEGLSCKVVRLRIPKGLSDVNEMTQDQFRSSVRRLG